jgi:hypothetical protein
MSLLKKLNIVFDADGNTILSKEKLQQLIQLAKAERTFWNDENFPGNCYVLVDRNSEDFYPFPIEELEEWLKDGSFEKGDYLYKMSLEKKL